MNQRAIIYTRSHTGRAGTEPELLRDLRQAVENRGDTLAGSYVDDGQIAGRGKYAGWRKLLAGLDQVDEVIVGGAGDLPGKSVQDLLKVLETLRDHDVGLHLHHEQIDTSGTGFVLLDLIAAYRAAKLSAAIRNGQAKALAGGKKIGRPTIPPGVMARVKACLLAKDGTRSIARRFNISPASVINIRRTITEVGAEAA
jgi:DNA invertase Pin-like site-specific DNA recombinase